MRLRWFPWKFIIRRLARSHGFADPVGILSHLRRFAQPSEVAIPIELLRAGVVFHARGLINSRVIQQNLDWVWPYWIHRQFDPRTEAFIPRAFSLTHVNLTTRNWTAVGAPGCDALPIVDPRGLVTPFWDGWSLDAWVVADDGRTLVPSRVAEVRQRLDFTDGLAVVTSSAAEGLQLQSRAEVIVPSDVACRVSLEARADSRAWLVVSARPCNPEGVSFINRIDWDDGRQRWLINRRHHVYFDEPAQIHAFSDYAHGDVMTSIAPEFLTARHQACGGSGERRRADDSIPAPRARPSALPPPPGDTQLSTVPGRSRLFGSGQRHTATCDVGMATAAALFEIPVGGPREVAVRVPLEAKGKCDAGTTASRWENELRSACRLQIPDERMQFLYEAALRTLVLHCPDDVYPGPFTYKRFWFRDAAFILHAMLCAGLRRRAEPAIARFFPRQTAGGYFRSQEGEWDANGEVLWLLQRFCELTGRDPGRQWVRPVTRAGYWIMKKRSSDRSDTPCAGLMPAGFSAEHLGPNDYYYWDDFWSIAGLRSAVKMMSTWGQSRHAAQFESAAAGLMGAVERSLDRAGAWLHTPAMPASCHRRLDSGAIGSIVAGYPLQLFERHDERLLATVNFLMDRCLVEGGFFQDMIHSGINVYLTLHIAQVLLRAGDPRFFGLVRAVSELASPTGQWPEAIHPHTRGGCMGDGQHTWAAAEWVMMMRNCLLYEETQTHRLIFGAGVVPTWRRADVPLSIGPAPTSWGPIQLFIEPSVQTIRVRWEPEWFDGEPEIEIRLPGTDPVIVVDGRCSVDIGNSQETNKHFPDFGAVGPV